MDFTQPRERHNPRQLLHQGQHGRMDLHETTTREQTAEERGVIHEQKGRTQTVGGQPPPGTEEQRALQHVEEGGPQSRIGSSTEVAGNKCQQTLRLRSIRRPRIHAKGIHQYIQSQKGDTQSRTGIRKTKRKINVTQILTSNILSCVSFNLQGGLENKTTQINKYL